VSEIFDELSNLSKDDLVSILDEIYQLRVDEVCNLIDLNLVKDNPKALTKKLRDEINKWMRRTRFISYRESYSYSLKITAVRESIQNILMPLEPKSAWKLIDKIVRNDGKILDAVDDSGGSLGDELNQCSVLWLEAASLMNLPDSHWLPLVIEITDGDKYGCRNNFLQETHLLLAKDSIKQIFNHYKSKLSPGDEPPADNYNYSALSFRINMGQAAIALKNPELYEESIRLLSPEPNSRQLLDIIRIYVQFGRYEYARKLLDQQSWSGRDRFDVDKLYKEIFKELGDDGSLIDQYKKTWEWDPSIVNLEKYLEIIDPAEKDSINKIAVDVAVSDTDFVRGFSVLIYLEEIEPGETLILSNQNYFNERFYTTLLWLIDLLEDRSPVSQIVIYRALLMDLLKRAYSKAYNHAAKYYKKLNKIDKQMSNYPSELINHRTFCKELHEKHGRKKSFWSKVEK
jgi:hypothetical protein